MIRALRRTFSRRGRHHPHPSQNYTATDNDISEAGVHIPAPEVKNRKSLITVLVILLDGTDVSVDVHVMHM